MMSIFRESKKLGRFVAAHGIERSPRFVGAIAGETERRQELAVKLRCSLKVFHSQINVIQNSCFHFIIILSLTCCFATSSPSPRERIEVRAVFGFRGESSTSIPTRSRRLRRLLCPRTRAATKSPESRPQS